MLDNKRAEEIIKVLNDAGYSLAHMNIRYCFNGDYNNISEIGIGEIREVINCLLRDKEKLINENSILRQRRANIFEIANAFSRGRKDSVKKFAKYLIDKADNGVVCVSDLPEYVLTFCEELEVQDGK